MVDGRVLTDTPCLWALRAKPDHARRPPDLTGGSPTAYLPEIGASAASQLDGLAGAQDEAHHADPGADSEPSAPVRKQLVPIRRFDIAAAAQRTAGPNGASGAPRAGGMGQGTGSDFRLVRDGAAAEA